MCVDVLDVYGCVVCVGCLWMCSMCVNVLDVYGCVVCVWMCWMFMDVCWIVGVLVAVILTGEYV